MQNFNHHTHTYRCGHADDSMSDEDYVKEFINQGFKAITFTDHAPQKELIDKRSRMRMNYSEIDNYLNSIHTLKEKYKDIIKIETGFEIEFLPGQEANLIELKNISDKIVLGQHYIYDKDKQKLKIFRKDIFDNDDLMRYADYIATAMKLRIPDIVVHPDLYMIGRNNFGEIEQKAAEIICEASEKYNIPLEINLTEAFMFLCNMKKSISYPCKEFWKIASNYNIKVLYGIDAHYREQIRLYEKSIDLVNKIIGQDIISKLNFIKEL